MSKDIIYREDAIKTLQENVMFEFTEDEEWATTCLQNLPSADRPQGHYIKGESGEWYCSECKRIDDKYSVANFCWYCGARMK